MGVPQRSLSNFPMVGNRNGEAGHAREEWELIELSDGGESERRTRSPRSVPGAYRTFRWWGIGTGRPAGWTAAPSLSNFPMVGNRNQIVDGVQRRLELIELSDGGESELRAVMGLFYSRAYRTFRWWGIGTPGLRIHLVRWSLSNFPMVGNRNVLASLLTMNSELIELSDGGESERSPQGGSTPRGAYRTFRWWGIGTTSAPWPI